MESPTSASLSCDSGSSIIDRDDGSRLENSQVDSPSASSELNDRSPHVQELSNTATGSEHSKTALTIVNDEDGINANNRHLQPTNSDEGVTNKNVNGALHDGVALTDNVKKDEANFESPPKVDTSTTSILVTRHNQLQRSLSSQCALAASLGLLPADNQDTTSQQESNGCHQSNGSGGRVSTGNTYPVSRQWLHHWVYYLYAAPDDETVANPGPLEMEPLTRFVGLSSDAQKSNPPSSEYEQSRRMADFAEQHSDDEDHGEANEYVPEAAWRRLADWYGVASGHPLDRKLLNGAASFNDCVEFEICRLSAFCGIIEHQTTWFNRFEEIGYIEFQLRRIFGVPATLRSHATRMWISERELVPPIFRLLENRNRMLNDHLQRDRKYILALEVCDAQSASKICLGDGDDVSKYSTSAIDGRWPTGEPGEPKGDLDKYLALLGRTCGDDDIISNRAHCDDVVTGDGQQETTRERSSQNFDSAILDLCRAASQANRTDRTLVDCQQQLAYAASAAEAVCNRARSLYDDVRRREAALEERKRRVSLIDDQLAAVSAELAERRKRLEAARARAARERESVERLVRSQLSRIRLDVGGTVFETSRQTMINRDPTSLLAAMFSDNDDALKPEDDGSYFIDRDGAHFRYVIEYLRNGAAASMPPDIATARHVLCEAKFYQLRHLVKRIEDWLIERNVSIV